MNVTRLNDALRLDPAPPYWLWLVAAVGLLIVLAGFYLFRKKGNPRDVTTLILWITGGFFTLFALAFWFARAPLNIQINLPPGRITIQGPGEAVSLPFAEFHSLYKSSLKEERRTLFRLYLRRAGGRNILLLEDESEAKLDSLARDINTITELRVVKSAERPELSPAPVAPAPAPAPDPEWRAFPNLKRLDSEFGPVYFWDVRQYWLVLIVAAWAGILYLLLRVIPRQRGFSFQLILFQLVFSIIFIVLLVQLPTALLGKQCVLLGADRIYVWQDVGGTRIRKAELPYRDVEFVQRVWNDDADPFLTLIPADDVRRIQNAAGTVRSGVERAAAEPDLRVDGVNPLVLPILVESAASLFSLRLLRMIQLDPRPLTLGERIYLEDVLLQRLPADLRRQPSEPDFLARKIAAALLRSF